MEFGHRLVGMKLQRQERRMAVFRQHPDFLDAGTPSADADDADVASQGALG